MMSRLAVAAAIAVIVVGGAVAFGPLVSSPGPGATQGPSVAPTAAPSASLDGALASYRSARNRICATAVEAFSTNTDLVGLYDESTAPDRRAIVNANAQKIADAIATMASDLAELEPPAELAEAHTADVAHAQNQAAIFGVAMQALRDGRLSDARAMELAQEAASNLRRPFEEANNLLNCP